MKQPIAFVLLLLGVSCSNPPAEEKPATVASAAPGTYAFDKAFLQKQVSGIIELKDSSGQSAILLSPSHQGRVMTSTAAGDSGMSFGWINYKLLESGERKKQFNPAGGEERFWLGPEGGQYALYFSKGDSFTIGHWQVPALIDTDTFTVASQNSSSVVFTKEKQLVNYAGFTFSVGIRRTVSLLSDAALRSKLQLPAGTAAAITGYETKNELTNKGKSDWKPATGLLSIWLLGMMTPSPQTVVVLPFRPGQSAGIADDYFGKVPAERLLRKDSAVYFLCDGNKRSKIGLSPAAAKPVAVSVDLKNHVINLVFYQVDPTKGYVNSKWEYQQKPYGGDVVNSYNDGPLADGSQMGPFYEIESSSPALALKQGDSYTYTQVTVHVKAEPAVLEQLLRQYTGASLGDIQQSFFKK